MRLPKLLPLGLLSLLVAAPAVLLFLALQPLPLVQPPTSPHAEDVTRFKALVKENDPRTLRDGETRTLSISQRDLNLVLRMVLPFPDRQLASVNLSEGASTLHYTLHLPENPLGKYFNLTFLVSEDQGQPLLAGVQLGDINLPGWSMAFLMSITEHALESRFPEYAGARKALQNVSLGAEKVSLTYRWDKTLAKQIEQRGREVFLTADDRERALAYYQVLTKTSRSAGASAPLDKLLQPMFYEAVRRSTEQNAAAENRSLFLVLGTVLNRSSMHRLVGGDPADLGPGHRYVRWTLHGRGDLAQHFGISAAIAAAGGGTLANAIGVFKELDDSRGGSGFSFADLLADRAGVELSAAATGADALKLQMAMASKRLKETDFMPSIQELPEGLMELEFKQRYQDLDDARYAHVKREIDSRIASLPIYR